MGGGEWCAEFVGIDAGCECEVSFGSVVIVAAGGQEDAVAGHGAAVVVGAFDFVVGITEQGIIAVVDGAGDGQAHLGEIGIGFALVDHV